MALLLSIDLAYTSFDGFGFCLVEERGGRPVRATFPKASDLRLEEPPTAASFAKAVAAYCHKNDIHIVLLDGPQGWKDPSGQGSFRVCEVKLATPFKTGVHGDIKPRNARPFVDFSVNVFGELRKAGAELATKPVVQVPNGGLLAVESFPTAAWRELEIKPLPAKPKAKPEDLRERLGKLKDIFGLEVDGDPSHDELQALVAGLAGVAILAGDPSGYIAEGCPPKEVDGHIVEGFIVNPRRCSSMTPKAAADHGPRTTEKDTTSRGGRASPVYPDPSTLKKMLYYLKVTREAEYRIECVLYRQGKIVGGVYVGRGQEAIAVGSAIQLLDGDVAFPTHRDFAAFLIRGFTLREIFSNWLGRANGPTRGRENTTHLGSLKLGVIPIISPLGDTCPVACGTALIQKQRGKGHVTLVHFGEGTTSRGDVHEAMNMAAVWKLPVVFICNNNAYAYSTPTELQYAVKELSVRGPAYGMPGVTIDGNDVLEVYQAVREAIERGRVGKGPTFIECKTFRMTGHSAHDAAEYVPKERFEEEARKDPIPRLENLLLARRVVTPERIREMEQQIQKEIDEAVAFAEASPMPEGATAVEGVYCGPDCWWQRTFMVPSA